MPGDLWYVLLLFALFVVPKALQRWRVPGALTSLGLGALASAFDLYQHDATVHVLATFGVVSLFLFAGLEVEVDSRELRRGAGVVVQHLVIRLVLLALVTLIAVRVFPIGARAAALVALALLTSSVGFILDSLGRYDLTRSDRFWIRSKAITAEMLALLVLLVTVKSTSVGHLALAVLALAALIAVIPLVFRLFAVRLAPYAPRSEFAFLLMVAVVCAYATRELGVYYLVGAFLVGIAAQRFRERLPAMSSEKMMHAVEAFASVFVPFYFFDAGHRLRAADFGGWSFVVGLAFVLLVLPLRIVVTALHLRAATKDPLPVGMRIGVALSPTLVFGLVIAEILRDRFLVPGYVFGGLFVYTIVSTVLPTFVLGAPAPEFDTPHLVGPEPEPSAVAPAPPPAAPATAPSAEAAAAAPGDGDGSGQPSAPSAGA